MKNDKAFVLKFMSLFLSGMLSINVDANDNNTEGQRKGWKTNGHHLRAQSKLQSREHFLHYQTLMEKIC